MSYEDAVVGKDRPSMEQEKVLQSWTRLHLGLRWTFKLRGVVVWNPFPASYLHETSNLACSEGGETLLLDFLWQNLPTALS